MIYCLLLYTGGEAGRPVRAQQREAQAGDRREEGHRGPGRQCREVSITPVLPRNMLCYVTCENTSEFETSCINFDSNPSLE